MRRDVLAALAALVVVGAWLAFGAQLAERAPASSDTQRFEWILGHRKLGIELRERSGPGEAPHYEYRFLEGPNAGAWLDAARFQSIVAHETERRAGRHWLLRVFNASSWASFLWVGVGLAGQLCFFGRMLVQWLTSERERASVVPPVFWWLSLAGGLCLLSYFVWRLDAVGVIGQSTGAFVYMRNLVLIRRRTIAQATAAETEAPVTGRGDAAAREEASLR